MLIEIIWELQLKVFEKEEMHLTSKKLTNTLLYLVGFFSSSFSAVLWRPIKCILQRHWENRQFFSTKMHILVNKKFLTFTYKTNGSRKNRFECWQLLFLNQNYSNKDKQTLKNVSRLFLLKDEKEELKIHASSLKWFWVTAWKSLDVTNQMLILYLVSGAFFTPDKKSFWAWIMGFVFDCEYCHYRYKAEEPDFRTVWTFFAKVGFIYLLLTWKMNCIHTWNLICEKWPSSFPNHSFANNSSLTTCLGRNSFSLVKASFQC